MLRAYQQRFDCRNGTSDIRDRADSADDTESRHLTAMFTDLVGSTALSTKLDLEDRRAVIGAYRECVADTVAGFHAKYMGDRALIYFGYPRRTRMTPSALYGQAWRSPRRSASCPSESRSRCASGGAGPAWSSWAILLALGAQQRRVASIDSRACRLFAVSGRVDTQSLVGPPEKASRSRDRDRKGHYRAVSHGFREVA